MALNGTVIREKVTDQFRSFCTVIQITAGLGLGGQMWSIPEEGRFCLLSTQQNFYFVELIPEPFSPPSLWLFRHYTISVLVQQCPVLWIELCAALLDPAPELILTNNLHERGHGPTGLLVHKLLKIM